MPHVSPNIYDVFEHFVDSHIVSATTGKLPETVDYIPSRSGSEHSISTFATLPSEDRGELALIKGRTGSGKSTTLDHVKQSLIAAKASAPELLWLSVDYFGYDDTAESTTSKPSSGSSAPQTDSWRRAFLDQISAQLTDYWKPHGGEDAEILNMWDWHLSNPQIARLASTWIIAACQGEPAARLNHPDRLDCHLNLLRRKFLEAPETHQMGYLSCRIAYLEHAGVLGRVNVVVAVDNIDHLNPLKHQELFQVLATFAGTSRCQIIVTSRPMTIRNSGLGLTEDQPPPRAGFAITMRRIMHIGPRPSDVVAHRIRRYLIEPTIEQLKSTIEHDNSRKSPSETPLSLRALNDADGIAYGLRGDVAFDLELFRTWGVVMLNTLGDPDPSMGTYIDNIAGSSIRFGKIMFNGVCAHKHIDWMSTLDCTPVSYPSPRSDRQTIIRCRPSGSDTKNRRLSNWISAVLGGASDSIGAGEDVVDNLYASTAIAGRHALAKPYILRILSKAQRHGHALSISDLWAVLSACRFDHDAIRDAIGSLAKNERDIIDVPLITPLDRRIVLGSLGNAIIRITDGGEFYLNSLSHDFDYLMACARRDVFDKSRVDVKEKSIRDRLRTVRQVIAELICLDRRATEDAMANDSRRLYELYYPKTSFGLSLLRKATESASAIVGSLPSQERHDVKDELWAYSNFTSFHHVGDDIDYLTQWERQWSVT